MDAGEGRRRQTNMQDVSEVRRGVAYAAGSYVLWGIIPVFWKLLSQFSTSEILVFRIVGTVVFAGAVAALLRRGSQIAEVTRNAKAILALIISALLIGGNWWLFVWSVNNDRILETSLGYFINPLVSIVLGVAVLGERLNAWQMAAIGIACLGVINQAVAAGVLPWISLTLAVSFALYGLVRKQVAVASLDGLLVETTLLLPLTLGYLLLLTGQGQSQFLETSLGNQALLLLAGPVTAVPLLLFAAGVRRVRLSTMGFLQYIAPSLSMLVAVFVYAEPFTSAHAVTFGLIWTALAIVSVDALRRERYSAA
ncbi:MAG TPA: EamA family transporter RarD [Alphaproteobacteria bacterium]|nr:EamA family transporter RarD [Alphaproteobacteria bacterium]